MNYYCHSCGAKNNYVNGVKPKFCTNCGTPLDTAAVKKEKQSQEKERNQSRQSWRDDWKGGAGSKQIDDDGDLDEIMKELRGNSGFNIEKAKFLTVADLKDMPAESTGRNASPQGDKELSGTRAEIMKNLGVSNKDNAS